MVSGREQNNFTSYGELKVFGHVPFFGTYRIRKSAQIPNKIDTQTRSVCGFLPGLALMKTAVLESMRTLSYFRLDTLTYNLSSCWKTEAWDQHCNMTEDDESTNSFI